MIFLRALCPSLRGFLGLFGLFFVLLTLLSGKTVHAQWASGPALSSSSETTAPAPARLQASIVALVNDEVITSRDLEARTALVLLSSNLPDRPEIRAKLAPQVLRNLIDEKLQLEEGEQMGLFVAPSEIEDALAKLAQDNAVPSGDIKGYLSAHNVPPETLEQQAKASLTWRKIVLRTLRPKVEIGTEEIQATIERMKANAGKTEYRVSEIFLPVDTPQNESEAHDFAEKLKGQIEEGAIFEALARQFSQGAGAANGGDLGWIQQGQLPPQLDQALTQSQAGALIGPVRIDDGYHILAVRDTRLVAAGDPADATITWATLFRPFQGADLSDATKQETQAQLNDIASKATNCEEMKANVAAHNPSWTWLSMGSSRQGDLPAWIQEKITTLPQARPSAPVFTAVGAQSFVVCERKVDLSVDEGAIVNRLGTEKLEMLARRLMRDLRRKAHIEIRKTGAM